MIVLLICNKLTNPFPTKQQLSKMMLTSLHHFFSSRTERFVEFRQRKEDEMKCVKARAEKKVLWLEKQHGLAISKIESKMYRLERSHTKEVVCYENTIESLMKKGVSGVACSSSINYVLVESNMPQQVRKSVLLSTNAPMQRKNCLIIYMAVMRRSKWKQGMLD
jgi:hypothetical protein